ncbi:protein kinase-like domain, concanavalin A-like lectin/glucanase domain protein [Tanacetum coccineum]|uniref:Protein kinase-like domain, concanavalin A-like lectin/glucanase domain protein n=1 Tax=Tanacetum coccineum TaxID=301880 RepID=A0ABQ5AJI5_9ASTR
MRELREDTFSGNKNDDAHDHVERVLDIVSLFNISRVIHEAVMLRGFPITLTRAAKRWVDRLSPGTVDFWDLFKKAFIQRYCPPSKTAKQLEEICNFKQEGDKTLYQAWEMYNELLYKSQLTTSIAIRRNIDSSSNTEGIAAIVSKLDSLGRDIKKLKENVHAIQVGCQTCEGAHLDKECLFNEEVKSIEEVKYREFCRPFPNNSRYDGRFNRGVSRYDSHDQLSSGERRPSLIEIINNIWKK